MVKREKKAKSVKLDAIDLEELAEVDAKKKSKRVRIEVEDDDDDDAEANEDLSLKIVEKAMLRGCKTKKGSASNEPEVEIVTNMKVESRKIKKEKKTKKKKEKQVETQEDPVSSGIDKGFKSFCSDMSQADEMKEEIMGTLDMKVDDEAEKSPVEMSDNVVLRRLLRGPRYFDPPDNNSWGACYNCGEEGHAAVNCTSAKRKKPCFVCGSFDHNAKQCAKGKDCFICKKGGHRAKDCPDRNQGGSQSSRMCLKCGDSGHDLFSCRNNYSADDVKEMQCYICKSFGHLCCANYPDSGPREISCYRCGLLGHTGLACTESCRETSGAGPLSSCYRCGEEGHFARECTNFTKVNKWNGELSTPKKKVFKERKEHYEFRSAPHDFGKARKKTQYDGGYTSDYKTQRRGGWITDDPEDFPQPDSYRSPSTPRNKRTKISNFGAGGHASVSPSSRMSNRLDFNNSASYGSVKYHHHRFSASRFGNSSHDGRRNYEW